MLNYMLKSYYMLHYLLITCSITCFITCSTIPLHVPLHDNYMINYMIHYILNYLPLHAWHEISWAHDHMFLVPPSTPKKSPSLSASGAQDSRRRLRQLMRGLLERILLSCHKHENTGLESVRIMKHGLSNSKWVGESNPLQKSKWVGESNPPQNSKWVGESNRSHATRAYSLTWTCACDMLCH